MQEVLHQARQHIEAKEFDRAESLCADVLVADPVCVPAHQLMARVWLGRNQPDKVRDRIGYRDQLPHDEHYVEWGLIAEEMDDWEAAGQLYEELLQREPQNAVALYRLGLLCIERGERDRAVGLLQRTLRASPEHAPAAFELAQCYAEDELWGLAADAYERGLERDPANEEARTALQVVEARMRELAELPTSEVPAGDGPTRRMRVLFAGRENVHARQWIDEGGRVGYSPVHEPLAEHLLALHLQGTATLGVYPVRADQTVLFGAIDIDVRKNALPAGQPVAAQLLETVRADARRLARQFEQLHLPVYVEDSGYKGVHLWFFLAEPVPAAEVKRFLEAVVQRVGPPDPQLQWEVFPKQEQVAEGQLGNLIKLPLGIHLKTGRRCLFTDLEGQEYSDQEGFLARIQQVERKDFERAVSRLVTRPEQGGAVESAQALRAAFPEYKALFEGCPVLVALTEKAVSTHHLTHDERLVLKCVLAHLGEGGQRLIHSIIGHCLDYSESITQQQIERTPPSPISCPKIRQRLPEVTSTVNCACVFELPEGGYPSPLLHLDASFTKGRSHNADRHGSLVDKYVNLRRDHQRLGRELAQLEDDLRYALDSSGQDELRADGWILRRDGEGRLKVEIDLGLGN